MADEAFVGAGQATGLEIWRIEDMKPVKQDSSTHGTFFKGDSYIVLDSNTQKKTWNLHFWLGAESSTDEKGVAAFKTVELDDFLGGKAIQYRELDGSESSLFLSYFEAKGGIFYKDGGVKSGFNQVDRDAFETRLLHLKGKRTVRVKEVAVEAGSLNSGDVFILDQGMTIIVYEGTTANTAEKRKGAEVARFIKNDQRSGKAKIHCVSDDEEAATTFWAVLGGEPASIPEGADDDTVPAPPAPRLRAVGADADVDISGGLKKDLLASDKVFLLSSQGDAYIWIGKQSSPEDKKAAMDAMDVFLADAATNTPSAQVSRVSEGVESGAFKSKFQLWMDPVRKLWGSDKPKTIRADQDVDFAQLLSNSAKEELGPDDADGDIKVWRIENMKKVEYPVEKYGQFFGGDSFIVLYTYKNTRGKESYIIYFWQGLTSSTDELGTSAILTQALDDSMGGSPVQVRVTQGNEPAHFRALFKGKMVVHHGGIPAGFKNEEDVDSTDQDGTALFQVRGTGSNNAVASQVKEVASSLNSGDTFVLVKPDTVFVWKGEGATDGEKECATSIANTLANDYLGASGREVVQLEEGAEDETFWSALEGGKGEYAKESFGGALPRDPRLFQLSTETGSFRCDEVGGFSQSSLIFDDVMLLDTFTQVFLWIGDGATAEEKTKSSTFAKQYIDAAIKTDGREATLPVITVTQRNEPVLFTCHFLGWDDALMENVVPEDPYEKKMKEVLKTAAVRRGSVIPEEEEVGAELERPSAWKTNADSEARAASVRKMEEDRKKRLSVSANGDVVTGPPPVPTAGSTAEYEDPASATYTHEELKGKPKGVNPTYREQYLSDADFEALFSTDKASFLALPKWKQATAKKQHDLF